MNFNCEKDLSLSRCDGFTGSNFSKVAQVLYSLMLAFLIRSLEDIAYADTGIFERFR
jgi:hypothetical protein